MIKPMTSDCFTWKLNHFFLRWGIPVELVSDNGKLFIKLFKLFKLSKILQRFKDLKT